MGRPRKELPWEQIDELCKIQCTIAEIASVLGISVDTLQRRCKEETGNTFAVYLKEKSLTGNASLRRAQFKAALRGNTGLLIWLGKNMLGQKDNIIHAVENDQAIKLAYETRAKPKQLENKDVIDVEAINAEDEETRD